jgi:hypothetical protein
MNRCCRDRHGSPRAPRAPLDASPPPRRCPVPGLKRIGRLAEWTAPVVTLALIPKCPGCVAAYILFATGCGVSLSTASTLRTALIALSVAGLALLVFNAARRAVIGRARFSLYRPWRAANR